MPVAPQAFLDIESSLADRLYSAWQKESRPLLRKIWSALEQDNVSTAIDLANGINLSSIVEKNADYIDYLSNTALLFGASRVTSDPRLTSIPYGNFDDILASSQQLLNHAIKYNVEDHVRFALLEAIAAYDLTNPATNFTHADGPLADYVVKDDLGLWDESEHPRQPAGSEHGGEFAPKGGGTTSDDDLKPIAIDFEGNYSSGYNERAQKLLTPEQFDRISDAVLYYKEGKDSYEINRVLRHGASTGPKIQKVIEGLDEAFERVAAPITDAKTGEKKDVVVHRVINNGKQLGLKEGDVVEDKGFVSTSYDPTVPERLAKMAEENKEDAVFVEIVIPKGTPILPVLDTEGMKAESEILLNRASRFRVASLRGNKVKMELLSDKDRARATKSIGEEKEPDRELTRDDRFTWFPEDIIIERNEEEETTEKWDESQHPRDEDGRFTDGGETLTAGGTAHFKESLGIQRKDMPQIRAHDMPEFAEWANKQGVAVRDETEHVSSLRPAQDEYNPRNAAQLPAAMLDTPLTVSRDNYVLDGTNRWVRQRSDDPEQQVAIRRIDLPATEALRLMHRFPKAFSKGIADIAKYDESQPRDPAGSPTGGQWSASVRAETVGMAFNMEKKQWEHPTKKISERDQARLRERVVPPGWVNVHLNPDETAPLQVLGQDAAGRWQPRYSLQHIKEAAVAKFARGRDFAKIAPQVTATIERDMANPEKVNEAAAMRLIQLTGIRIGGEKGVGVAHTAIGASNLKAQHVKVDGDKITLSFTGKSGVRQHMTVNDSQLSSYLRGRNLQKGDTVFGTTDAKMREYFKSVAGSEFKVKDVRMWVGTATAIKELAKVRQPKDEKQFKAMAKDVAKKVSKVLGNTPAMAMSSYIDPLVWQPWNEKFPGALEPKKRVKKDDLDDMQELLDEFYASISFDEPITFDWRDFPETGLDPDDDEDDEQRVLESDDDPLDLRKPVAQKAETPFEAGRRAGIEIVRPFVSFRQMADSTAGKMLQLVSGLHTSRLSAYGFTIEAEVTGVTTYAISAQLDNRVCPVCEYMHGMEFEVGDATEALNEILKADDPESLRSLQPWPKQDQQNMSEFYEMSSAELVDRNWHIPPYHPNCRCLLVKVEDVHEIEATPSWRAAFSERAENLF